MVPRADVTVVARGTRDALTAVARDLIAAQLLPSDLSDEVEVAVSRQRTDPWTWHVGQHGDPAGRPAG